MRIGTPVVNIALGRVGHIWSAGLLLAGIAYAVVSIGVVTTRIVRGFNPLYDDFFDSFFREFLPPTRYYKYRESIPNIGSGVIVSRDGYVVTNQHVVREAEEITVVTPDGLKLTGTVAGVHEASDIAVIKVEADDLPYAPLGDSDNLMVGEWAIAIGNPFGNLIEDAHPSVTVGVISARKRSFKPSGAGQVYRERIQTDAAINPGNSGGPLVNADGEVIGINTFIFTRSGGSLGVGFAIPINRVKRVLEEVRTHGKVRDVWLGFTVITVDNETARALKLHPTLYRVALQSMRLRKKYDLILIPAGSFGLITDELEIRSALENLHRHLLPAGVLLIEIETVRAQALPPKIWSSDWVTKVNGDKIILSTLPRFDEQTKILTLLQRYELWHRNQISRTEVEELRVRLYPFNEFTSYLEETGFYPINAYRPYTRNLPTSQSPSVLYECHKVN